MIVIFQPVGAEASNLSQDVRAIQSALNNIKWTIATPPLFVDGIAGKKTISAIRLFQKIFLNMIAPDGRIDPNGRTIKN